MSIATEYHHLRFDADGVVRIGATRFRVRDLATEHYAFGWSAEELLRQHPDLRPEQVYSALVYFYDHFDEMTAAMQLSAERMDERRQTQPITREELLRRRTASGG